MNPVPDASPKATPRHAAATASVFFGLKSGSVAIPLFMSVIMWASVASRSLLMGTPSCSRMPGLHLGGSSKRGTCSSAQVLFPDARGSCHRRMQGSRHAPSAHPLALCRSACQTSTPHPLSHSYRSTPCGALWQGGQVAPRRTGARPPPHPAGLTHPPTHQAPQSLTRLVYGCKLQLVTTHHAVPLCSWLWPSTYPPTHQV